MATVNNIVVCIHCESKIRIRIGVGYSKKQPFTFTCKKCGTVIKGALILKEPPDTDLEIENAIINNALEWKEAEYVVECHEDFLLTNEPVGEDVHHKLPP